MQLADIDLSDIEFWARPLTDRRDAFTTLRADAPRHFFAEPAFEPDDPAASLFPQGPGYYAMTRHADVVEVSRRAGDFCSGKGTAVMDMPEAFNDFFGSMINMDDPRHARLRKIVSRVFTPKMLESMKADVKTIAADIVAGIADRGSCDFVTEVAALLPLRIIVDLMGIPRSEEQYIFDRTNIILGFTDEEYLPDFDALSIMAKVLQAGQDLAALVDELGQHRVANPGNDLTTALVTAEVDGDKLTTQELASFFILLVAAGNETTRNALAHAMLLLSQHPDQRAILLDDFEVVVPTAVEEVVRLASPVMNFRRTATRDGVRLGDQEFCEGDKLVLWYWSANRDEDVFADPHRFDVRRTPNDHVGFGGPGPHFCLGAHLARREITVGLREVFRVLPDIEVSGEPQHLRSSFINGIKHLPVTFTETPA